MKENKFPWFLSNFKSADGDAILSLSERAMCLEGVVICNRAVDLVA